ncbi:MAG: biopolymer transporter ExbD [Crocinitomicaceae bacterium]|nr:biopolymer transporter ExbD [Crocinitomicaceae bacterium]
MGIRSRNKVSVAFSMSSMTDIVFLLLIFFIIISTMVSPHALNVLLPKSKAKSTTPKTVAVTITPDFQFHINGNQVPVENLENGIISAIGEAEKKGIILHCDQSVPLEHAVTVMDIANRNKFELVLATRPK